MMQPLPCGFITRAACFMPNTTLPTSRRMTSANCSSVTVSTLLRSPAPALLNRQSRRPKRSTVWSIRAAMSASRMTSVRMKVASPPSSRVSASPFSALRPARTILAPSSAQRRAVASPMPLVPPVMTMTLSLSRAAMGVLLS